MGYERYGLPPQVFTAAPNVRLSESRVAVDVGQTGFFEGREFRMFRELTDNTSFVIEAVLPINVILTSLSIELVEGECRLDTVVGGTPSGTFGTPVPTFNRNNMTEAPSYTGQVTLNEGGTHTGGTLLDLVLARAADNSNFASNVSNSSNDSRGIAPDTYYFRVSSIGETLRGTIHATWEERPADLNQWLVEL